jgi:plasmid stability protein
MPALLIRDLDPVIARELKQRAKDSGESLSSVAQTLLRRGMARETPRQGLGSHLREVAAKHGYFDLEIERDKDDRPPPDFT